MLMLLLLSPFVDGGDNAIQVDNHAGNNDDDDDDDDDDAEGAILLTLTPATDPIPIGVPS